MLQIFHVKMAVCKIEDSEVQEKVPRGGYQDVKFIRVPPKALHCPLCSLVLKEPHLLSCCGGHICEVSQ